MIFKKATKSICAIISSVMIINCVNIAGTAESAESRQEIYTDLIQQLTNYNSQCLFLNEQYSQNMISETEYNSEKQSIYEKIDEVKFALSDIGADNADEDIDKMADILASDGKNGVSGLTRTAVYSATNYFKSALNSLSGLYDVYGNEYSYTYQGVTYDIYDITVSYSEKKSNSDAISKKLSTTGETTFNNAFSANSTGAKAWANQVIQVYESKLNTSTLNAVSGAKYLPYELFFSNGKPSLNSISSSKNSLVVELTTVTTLSYTFVSEKDKDTWTQCLTDNMVAYTINYSSNLSVNGKAEQSKIHKVPTRLLYGSHFTTRGPSASHRFMQMKQNKVSGILNGCQRYVAVKGSTGGSVIANIVYSDYLQGLV